MADQDDDYMRSFVAVKELKSAGFNASIIENINVVEMYYGYLDVYFYMMQSSGEIIELDMRKPNSGLNTKPAL